MKRFLIPLIVVAIGMVGVVYYALFAAPVSKHETKEVAETDSAPVVTGAADQVSLQGVGTVDSLRSLGLDLECHVTREANGGNGTVEGVYYVHNDQLRADLFLTSPDVVDPVMSSLLVRDDTLYAWSIIEGMSYGMMASTSSLTDPAVPVTTPMDLSTEVAYDCAVWSLDEQVFVVPKDILFRDVHDILRGGMEYGTVYESELEMQ